MQIIWIKEKKIKTNPDNKNSEKLYKKLGLKYHPDKNPDKNTKELFQVLSSIKTSSPIPLLLKNN